jgi:hypothetical protein
LSRCGSAAEPRRVSVLARAIVPALPMTELKRYVRATPTRPIQRARTGRTGRNERFGSQRNGVSATSNPTLNGSRDGVQRERNPERLPGTRSRSAEPSPPPRSRIAPAGGRVVAPSRLRRRCGRGPTRAARSSKRPLAAPARFAHRRALLPSYSQLVGCNTFELAGRDAASVTGANGTSFGRSHNPFVAVAAPEGWCNGVSGGDNLSASQSN